MGLGLLLSGLSGGADAAGNSLAKSQAVDDQTQMYQQLAQQRADLDTTKAMQLAQFQQDTQNAPLNRFAAALQSAQSQQIPVTAPAVAVTPLTKLTGAIPAQDAYSATSDQTGAPITSGIVAPSADLLARIAAMPDSNPDKAGILAQLKAQQATDTGSAQDAANSALAGQTRSPTQQEALKSTVSNLLSTDPQAAMAGMQLLPKPTIVPANSTVLNPDGSVGYRDDSNVRIATSNNANALAIANNKNANDMAIATFKASNSDPATTATMKEAADTYGEGTKEYKDFMNNYMQSKLGSSATGGARNAVMNGRVITSGNEIAKTLQNIVDLPVGSTTGMMGAYQPGSSLFGAGATALKSELTPSQTKTYNTMWTGISRNLGTLETSGLATTGSLISSIDKLSFQPGDTGYDAMRKLAEVRQITTAALEPKLLDPSLTAAQKGYIQGVMDSVTKAVPYTHSDLTAFDNAQNQNPDLTFSQYAAQNKIGGASTPAPSATPSTSPATSLLPKGVVFTGLTPKAAPGAKAAPSTDDDE